MRQRGLLILGIVLGVVSVVLAGALAKVGTELDEARDDLRFEVATLEEEVDSLTEERDQLKAQTEERPAAAPPAQPADAAPQAP
jgi:chaperonin cofactor prefoldin